LLESLSKEFAWRGTCFNKWFAKGPAQEPEVLAEIPLAVDTMSGATVCAIQAWMASANKDAHKERLMFIGF